MSIHAMDATRFGRLFGGRWTRMYATTARDGAQRYVYRRDDDPTDIRVLGLAPLGPAAVPVTLSGESTVYLESWRDDPACADLITCLTSFTLEQILRYRPGKRMTVMVRDANGQRQVLKVNGRGIGHSYDNLATLHAARDRLGFQIAEPLWINPERTVFAQGAIDAVALKWGAPRDCKRLATAIVTAIDTLHCAPIHFDTVSGLDEQIRRSDRYLERLQARHPSLASDTAPLMQRLEQLTDLASMSLRSQPRPLRPVHGSLHAGQWLHTGNRLALVDVERCALGFPEQDAAHFVATWDYEPAGFGEPIIAAFLAAMPPLDIALFTWFRAHRHLAKAWKATRAGGPDALDKTRRNLQRAHWILGASLRRTS